MENGVITRFSLRWNHYIDPQGQANKWIKNLVRAVGRKARIGETVFYQELCKATSGFGSKAAKPQAISAQPNQHQTVSTSTFIPGGFPLSGKAVQGRRSPHVSKQGIRFPLWLSTNILGAFTSQNNTSISHNGFQVSRTEKDQGGITWLLRTVPTAKMLKPLTTTSSPETYFTALLKDQAGD